MGKSLKLSGQLFRFTGMRKALRILGLALSMVLIVSVAQAAVKAGSPCSKLNATATVGGKKYTCIKSGKKMLWNKGVAIASPKPTASPTATVSATPTPTPTPTPTVTPKPSPTPTAVAFKATVKVSGLYLITTVNDPKALVFVNGKLVKQGKVKLTKGKKVVLIYAKGVLRFTKLVIIK